MTLRSEAAMFAVGAEAVAAFRQAMEKAGIGINEPILPDGNLHRFYVEGDGLGSKNGWYVFFDGALPAGGFGCWKRELDETWCFKNRDQLTPKEREDYRSRQKEAKKIRCVEQEKVQLEAQKDLGRVSRSHEPRISGEKEGKGIRNPHGFWLSRCPHARL